MRDLSEIERVAQAATKGPWRTYFVPGKGWVHSVYTEHVEFEHERRGELPPGHAGNRCAITVFGSSQGNPYDILARDYYPESSSLATSRDFNNNAEFIAAARTDVPDMAAQIRADDALLLACEWAAEDECGVNMFGEVSFIPVCPVCGQSCKRGHRDGCDLGRRCDEARARQGQ